MRERVAMIQSRDIYFHIKDRDTMQLMTRNLLTSFFCLTFLSSATALTPLEAGQDPRVFIEQSMAGLTAQQVAHSKTWGLDKASRWDIDQDAGLITFKFADGKVARAPVQIVGTYNANDGSFLWAWDHPSILEPLRADAKRARTWGEKHKLTKWTTRKVDATEAEAWEFTAVAARLSGANGAYRAAASGPIVFVTFGQLTLEKQKP